VAPRDLSSQLAAGKRQVKAQKAKKSKAQSRTEMAWGLQKCALRSRSETGKSGNKAWGREVRGVQPRSAHYGCAFQKFCRLVYYIHYQVRTFLTPHTIPGHLNPSLFINKIPQFSSPSRYHGSKYRYYNTRNYYNPKKPSYRDKNIRYREKARMFCPPSTADI